MRVAVVGSRSLGGVDVGAYLPEETTEIISGGARGVDAAAKAYAIKAGLMYREFLPDYRRYGRGAPLRRNEDIVAYADLVAAFWDGVSRGTANTIAACARHEKNCKIIAMKNEAEVILPPFR